MLDRPCSSPWPIALAFIVVALASELFYQYSHVNQGVIPSILLAFTALHPYTGFHIDLFHESESRVSQFLKVSLPNLLAT